MVKKIIINFPTNLGDAIIGLPVLDRLQANYPQAKISAISSPKTDDFLFSNNLIYQTILYKKSFSPAEKIRFCFKLRGKYDLIVDLKNSFLPVVLGLWRRTPFWRPTSKDMHVKDRYLKLIHKIAPAKAKVRSSFSLTGSEQARWQAQNLKKSIFIACSSHSQLKQYPYQYLISVVKKLGSSYKLVILGEERDREYYKDILTLKGVVDLVGKTTVVEVFYLLANYAQILLCVDSSLMHLASYINLSIVAIFGPTNPAIYGPWSRNSQVLRSKDTGAGKLCPPRVRPEEVVEAIKKVLANG